MVGELGGKDAKSISSGKIKKGLPSQGQPKWWRAGQGAFLVNARSPSTLI